MNTDFDAMNRSDEDYRDRKIKDTKKAIKIVRVGRERLLTVNEVNIVVECLKQGEEWKSAYNGLIKIQE